jgi:hypothetical protein
MFPQRSLLIWLRVRQLKREGRLAPWTMPNIGPQYRLLSERPSVKRMLEAEGIVAYPDD